MNKARRLPPGTQPGTQIRFRVLGMAGLFALVVFSIFWRNSGHREDEKGNDGREQGTVLTAPGKRLWNSGSEFSSAEFRLPGTSDRAPSSRLSRFDRPLGWDFHTSRIGQDLREAVSLEDPIAKSEAMQRLAALVIPAEIPEIMPQLSAEEIRTDFAFELLQRWSAAEPEEAAQWVASVADSNHREHLETTLAATWANTDPSGARVWAESLTAGPGRERALRTVGIEMARSTPLEALRVAVGMDPGELQTQLFEHAASQWTAQDPQEVADWAGEFPEGAARDSVIGAVATAWSESDPGRAAQFVLDTLPRGREQADALVSIVQRWAQQDAATVASWVKEFPEGKVRVAAVENLVQQWSRGNVAEAGRWLAEMPPDGARDQGARVYAEAIAADFPAIAMDWSLTIEDPTLRQSQAEELFGRWLKHDPSGPWEWLATAALSPELRRLLRK